MPKDKKVLTQVAKSLRAKKGKGAAEEQALALAEGKLKKMGVKPPSPSPAADPKSSVLPPPSQADRGQMGSRVKARANPSPEAQPKLTGRNLSKNHVASPDRRYSSEALDKAFAQIGSRGAAERADKLKAFMENQGIQAVFATTNHRATLLAANKGIESTPQLAKAATVKDKAKVFTLHEKEGANGFTSMNTRHVVVRGSNKEGPFSITPKIAGVVGAVAKQQGAKQRPWSMSDTIRKAMGGKDSDSRAFVTYIHEIGHQVHFAAGTIDPPQGVKYLTRYSEKNPREYFAEHFAAYMLDADAFRQFDPIGAQFIEDSFRIALKAKRRVP